MAFVALTTAEVTTGQPTKAEVGLKIKNNFDDHESRLTSAETAINTYRPIEFTVSGGYWVFVPKDGVLVERLNFDINVLSGRILVIDAGTAGTLEVDVEYSDDNGASWSSIFSTLPSVVYTAGNYALSTNGVLSTQISTNGLDTGDLLRLNIDTAQTGNELFKVILEIEKR